MRGSLRESLAKSSSRSSDETLGFDSDYEALSYCWLDGASKLEHTTMTIDGLQFRITKNLEADLYKFRLHEPRIGLWIDQICINQYDPMERSEQVQEMLHIYASAQRVHVWLGRSTEHSEVGMKALEFLCYRQRQHRRPPWNSLPTEIVRAGLEDVMSRLWFRRVWVVQEAAVARGVVMHCGPHSLSWLNTTREVLPFLRSIKLAVLSPQWISSRLQDVDMDLLLQLLQMQLTTGPGQRSFNRTRPPPDLLNIAYDMRHRSVMDPRDRIYGLLGLVDKKHHATLPIDYGMSWEEVYQHFEETMLKMSEQQVNSMQSFEAEWLKAERRSIANKETEKCIS